VPGDRSAPSRIAAGAIPAPGAAFDVLAALPENATAKKTAQALQKIDLCAANY
jgi:hypothetical protein